MSKELSGIEMTAIKVVDRSVNLAFPDDVDVELVFANRLLSRIESCPESSFEKSRARASLEGMYRQTHPYRQGKVRANVTLIGLGIPREGESGTTKGYFLVWVPYTVELNFQGDWIPKTSDFVASWPIGVDQPKYSVKTRRGP